MAFVADDFCRYRVLIGANDVAHFLRVEPLRQLGRAHEVDKHYRQLPPLRLAPGRNWRRDNRRTQLRRGAIDQSGDRRQNFATWAHWKTQLLQIIFAKMPQRIQIYFVLGEYPYVLV